MAKKFDAGWYIKDKDADKADFRYYTRSDLEEEDNNGLRTILGLTDEEWKNRGIKPEIVKSLWRNSKIIMEKQKFEKAEFDLFIDVTNNGPKITRETFGNPKNWYKE